MIKTLGFLEWVFSGIVSSGFGSNKSAEKLLMENVLKFSVCRKLISALVKSEKKFLLKIDSALSLYDMNVFYSRNSS